MGEKSQFEFTDGRLMGKAVEAIFFGKAKEQIEKFWHLKDLSEIQGVHELTVPHAIFKYIARVSKQTLVDGKERAAVFGVINNSPTILERATASQSFKSFIGKDEVSEISAGVSLENHAQFYWNRLFGKPKPIFFHAHPAISRLDIIAASATLPSGEKIEFPIDDYIKYINFHASYFSVADLEGGFESNRYEVSNMLSTQERMLYVVPPSLYMEVGANFLSSKLSEYKSDLNLLSLAAAVLFLGIPLSKFEAVGLKVKDAQEAEKIRTFACDEKTIKMARDTAMINACRRAGHVLFASDHAESRVLKKIS